MAKCLIKKGDIVVVLTGKENGKTAEVLECFPKENKVTVKGLNMIVKHNKPRSAQDKGGIVKKEGKIDASNVMVVCPVCNKATRVMIGEGKDGKKARLCKKCGAVLDSSAKKVQPKKTETKSEAKTTKKAVNKSSDVKKEVVKDTQKHETKSAPKKVTKSVPVAKKSSSTAKKIGGK
jgi:large subunit ribosomal protein L24